MPLFVINDSWATYGIKKVSRSLRNSKGGNLKISMGRSLGGRSGISYKFKNLKIYDEKLHAYLNTPDGDLWQLLEIRGSAAVLGAKAMVGVRTGALKTSIHKRHWGTTTGQNLWIGSELKYAYVHHQGSRPHLITPKPGGELVFRGRGRVLTHARTVHHPGTKPNPYLSSQLHHFDVH